MIDTEILRQNTLVADTYYKTVAIFMKLGYISVDTPSLVSEKLAHRNSEVTYVITQYRLTRNVEVKLFKGNYMVDLFVLVREGNQMFTVFEFFERIAKEHL